MSTDDDLPELPEDARAAIADAKAAGLVEPGAAVRARMRARLVGAFPPGGGSGGEGGGGGEGEGGRGGESGSGSGRGGAGALPRAPLWVVAAALAVGGAAGLLVPRAPVERIVVVPAPASSVASSSTVAAAPTLPSIDTKDLPSAPSIATHTNAGAAADASGTRNGDDLASERAALDVARTALGRGDGANALAACDDHARKFPRGALAEEREAIAVQALVLEHRSDDARARAERFRKTHPRSILLPAVLAAAGVEP